MIDRQRFDLLRDEIGAGDFGEVVELFLLETGEALLRLQAETDPARIVAGMHFLKGSALDLGLRSLARLCAAQERLARDGRPTDMEAVVRLHASSCAALLKLAEGPSRGAA